jgi:hypothetical protein
LDVSDYCTASRAMLVWATPQRLLSRRFSRYRRSDAGIPPDMRLCNVGRGWPLCVAILAIVETIFRANGNTVHRAKAIACNIGAATKWAWIWFHVGHIPVSKMLRGLLLLRFPAL